MGPAERRPTAVPVVETARVDIGDADAEFAAFVAGTSAELGRVAWYLSGDTTRAEDPGPTPDAPPAADTRRPS
jgi:hypothetical protein